MTFILLLCTANILTVLDQDFRNRAYDVVARITTGPVFGAIGSSTVAKTIEERNPALIERRAVELATMRLVERSALLVREIGELRSERANFMAERKTLQKQLHDSQAVISGYKNHISRLGQKVLVRASRSVGRHLAALPGHALPVLSATVAVGSAALDIRDACESVKELDELNRTAGLPSPDRTEVCGMAVPTAEELLADARRNWKSVYARSAEALNAGAQTIPRSPPSVSIESVRAWLASTFGR